MVPLSPFIITLSPSFILEMSILSTSGILPSIAPVATIASH